MGIRPLKIIHMVQKTWKKMCVTRARRRVREDLRRPRALICVDPQALDKQETKVKTKRATHGLNGKGMPQETHGGHLQSIADLFSRREAASSVYLSTGSLSW